MTVTQPRKSTNWICVRRLTLSAVVLALFCCAVRAYGAADDSPKNTAAAETPKQPTKSEKIFGAKMKWTGTENWTPPKRKTYKTNATFEVTERKGNKFTAVYKLNDDNNSKLKKGLELYGTVDGRKIRIKRAKFIEGSGPQHFTGNDILDLTWNGKVNEDGTRLTISAIHNDDTVREFDGTR